MENQPNPPELFKRIRERKTYVKVTSYKKKTDLYLRNEKRNRDMQSGLEETGGI